MVTSKFSANYNGGKNLLVLSLITISTVLLNVTAKNLAENNEHISSIENIGHVNNTSKQFYRMSTLVDGIQQVDVRVDGLRVRQTAVSPGHGSARGIVVREACDGDKLLSLVYEWSPSENRGERHPRTADLGLRECRIERDPKQVESFQSEFEKNSLSLNGLSFAGSLIPSEVESSSYRNLDGIAPPTSKDGVRTNISMRKWPHSSLGGHNVPHHITNLLKFHKLKKSCVKFNLRLSRAAESRWSESKSSGPAFSETPPRSRRRREKRSFKELFIFPGTKWCGSGNLAADYRELDGHLAADHCCRAHDLCPKSIPGLSKKYGFYNFGLTTISACACDKKFRTCLKQSGSGASEIVGNVFFNIVKSKCFELKERRVCLKRGAWRCRKWGREKRALVRDPFPWKSDSA